ncbi:MAG TPA: ABC transporter permease [Solirubrobacterales bacterium]
MEAGRIDIGTRTAPPYEGGGSFGFMRGLMSAAPGRIARLLLSTLTVALISTLLIFALAYFSPSNPAATKLGESATPAAVAHLNHVMGLDRGFFAQYFSWIGNALRGDFGTSWFSGVPVSKSIKTGLPVDLSVTGVALIMALAIGIPAGIVAGTRRGGFLDRGINAISSTAITLPVFWIGMVLVIVFAVKAKLLPATGYVPPSAGFWPWLSHLLLPGFALAVGVAAVVSRLLRNSLVATLEENFVVGATVRGLSPRRILYKHVLRNALAPTVTIIGLEIPQLLGAAVVTEALFALPGLGQLALTGAQEHDLPVIQGVLLVMVAIVLVCNLGIDALLGWLRPATRRGRP